MLSRTADNMYWLARYVERAEYLARILEATQRLTAVPTSAGATTNEWESAVATAGCTAGFYAAHKEANEQTVTDFLAFSPDNPSSIRSCFEVARSNARSVRTALTMEMWDAINGTWLELQKFGTGAVSREQFASFLRWVQECSLRFDGSAYRTMLRNDAYWFSRLGVFQERADNTARILDVKYHLLLPRSLASCYAHLTEHLDNIARAYGRQGVAQRHARSIRTRLENSKMEEIFKTGLHEFIGTFIADNNKLGALITEQYLI